MCILIGKLKKFSLSKKLDTLRATTIDKVEEETYPCSH